MKIAVFARPFALALVAASSVPVSVACSSDGGEPAGNPQGGGTNAGAGGASASGGSSATGGATAGAGAPPYVYKPCGAARVGGFSVTADLIQGEGTSEFAGSVRDGVVARDRWPEATKEGACAVHVGPNAVCTPMCGSDQDCVSTNQCAAKPKNHGVGILRVTGLKEALDAVEPLGGSQYFKALDEYPPFNPGDAITLSAPGGDYSAFTLSARGVALLEIPAKSFPMSQGQDLPLTWTPPPAGSDSRMYVSIDIAHHGGVAAEIRCDVPDTGSYTVPKKLVDDLLSRGVAGFPTAGFTRRTVASTEIAPGCVELVIATSLEREIVINGVTSCTCSAGDPCDQCPEGQTCRSDYTCH